MAETATIADELRARFPNEPFLEQPTRDGIPTFWVSREQLPGVLRYLKLEVPRPYPMLWDLTAIDERERRHREGQPPSDFTAVYQLLSLERNSDVRLKVALQGDAPSMPTVTEIWLRWQYIVTTPRPWSTNTVRPLKKKSPASTTRPGAGLVTGVPSGAAISMPLCGLRGWSLKNRREPYEFERWPLTGRAMRSSGTWSVL
jgi:hypothetical protein